MLRVALLLVVAFLLSGCAVLTSQKLKPEPETLTQGRFVYLADRACARDIQNTKHFKKPTSHEMYDRELKAATRSGEHLLFSLRGLAPPPAEAKEFRRMLDSLNYEDLLAHHLLEAGDQGEVERVKTLFKKGAATDRRFKARAENLGLHVCAKD